MSKVAVLVATVLLLAGNLCGPMIGAEPKTDANNASLKLEALKKRMPGITTKWCKNYFSQADVRIARLTSPTEAKITLVARNSGLDYPFVLYLAWYDGVWTVVRSEASESCSNKEFMHEMLINLALAIDESEAK